jgi:hypothetical protein
MPVEALRKQWNARASSAPLHCFMTFEGDALVLGAETKLASVEPGAPRPTEVTPASEARLFALLSVAYGRAIEPRAFNYVRRALVKRAQGEVTVASMHLALSGLPRLHEPKEDARRLFMADGLMKAGVAPRMIMQALEFDRAPLDELERSYDPAQPRVPAGNGRPSGRWTSGNVAGDALADNSGYGSDSSSDKPASASHPVQIADASDNWVQYLNPIETAEAAQRGPPFWKAINDQHQRGVDDAIAAYQACGFIIESNKPVYVRIPGFPTGRYYDFVARDPKSGELIGVEVKTTLYDTIFFDDLQVDKDAALLAAKGVFVPQLDEKITLVAYEAFCTGCSKINLRKADLWLKLTAAGISVRSYSWPTGAPTL